MANNKPIINRVIKKVDEPTLKVPGPIESWDSDAPWEWPDWPNGPVGAAQTGGKGIRRGRGVEDIGLNPFSYSFTTARSLLQKMRDAPPEGMGAPVWPERYPVTDLEEITRNINATAQYLGADLVGIVRLTPERIRLGVIRKEQEQVARFTHFIALSTEMDPHHFRTRLRHPNFSRPVRAPSGRIDVQKQYMEMELMCLHLASYIRGLGYNAESQGPGRRVMNGPFFNWAGIGETGRSNLLITPDFGPRVRLGGVLTDLPLAEDQPIDFGVQAFCESCRKCVRACPAGALTDGAKQLVRGVLKWPVNRKLCFEVGRTHGGEVDYGCQQCQVVCPYNRPTDFLDYADREEGENATLGLWTKYWHERGWSEDFTPPPRQERTPGRPAD